MGYYPGADEHQTGLAVNFVGENAEAKFSTPVLEWMREHCAEYGFILRYPEGREEYTGRDRSPAISAMSARSPRNTSCARASRWRNSRTPTTRAKTTPGQRRTINE